jgi:hypothetical protein
VFDSLWALIYTSAKYHALSMEITPTWDLVIASALILAFSYNFLLGKRGTIKLILSIYIAVLTADGVADIIKTVIYDNSTGFQGLIGSKEILVFMILRLIIFLVAILVFVIKGGFHVHLDLHDHWFGRSIILTIFSMLSAALFVSTVLVYLSGNSFVEGMIAAQQINFYQESVLARGLIDYYQMWFSFPAIGFLITSFFFDPLEVRE